MNHAEKNKVKYEEQYSMRCRSTEAKLMKKRSRQKNNENNEYFKVAEATEKCMSRPNQEATTL